MTDDETLERIRSHLMDGDHEENELDDEGRAFGADGREVPLTDEERRLRRFHFVELSRLQRAGQRRPPASRSRTRHACSAMSSPSPAARMASSAAPATSKRMGCRESVLIGSKVRAPDGSFVSRRRDGPGACMPR